MTTASSDNLLSALHRWASKQDENFITDSFAHLVRRLLDHSPSAALGILRKLTEGGLNLAPSDAKAIAVSTQVSTDLGRPDLEIRTLDHLIYIESKIESELGDAQLERYMAELDGNPRYSTKTLVLLSRYPITVPECVRGRVIQKRWYQVADWIEDETRQTIQEPVDLFLATQFLDFLRIREITMSKVEWQLPAGVESLRSLITMLAEAISAGNVQSTRTSAWDWIGFYLKNNKYFLGVYYNRPQAVVFETNEAVIVQHAAELAGMGRVVANRNRPNGIQWVNELLLDSEDVHFFALSRARQMQELELFLSQSLDAAGRIQAANP